MRSLLLGVLLLVVALAAQAQAATPTAEGYAVPYHLAQGETVTFHVSSSEPYQIRIWREAKTRVLMHESPILPAATPPTNSEPWMNGAGWPSVYQLTIPATWPSAPYLAELVPQDTPSDARFISFIVREDQPGSTSKILVLMTTNTWQAYNYWGGKSIYTSLVPGDPNRSTVVNFERPFARDTPETRGVSNHYRFYKTLIEWLDDEGITVEFAADADAHEIPDLLDRYNEVIVVASGEYYSKEMFDALQRFRDEGGSIALLGATNVYWAVRYEDQDRQLIAYKSLCPQDPYWQINPLRVTCLWDVDHMNRPNSSLTGGTYTLHSAEMLSSPCTVVQNSHWIFKGTHLHNGDTIGSTMCGGEVDHITANSPAGIQVLLSSVIPDKNDPTAPGYLHQASYYETADHKGRVFDAGTVRWVEGLPEGFDNDPNVGIITRNLVETFATRVETTPRCADGKDNDGDGLVDLDDPGCWGSDDPSEHDGALPCDDGLDNEADGLTDYPADPVCAAPDSRTESSTCQDGIDNDGDGTIDFDGGASLNGGVPLAAPDADCPTALGSEGGACGLGYELVFLGPLLAWRRRRHRAAGS